MKYCSTQFTGEELDNAINYLNQEVENYFGKVKTSNSDKVNYTPSILSVINENRDEFSELQIKYLLQCESIFMLDESANLNIVLEKLENLESCIKRDLSKKETQVVMIYLEVVKSSIQYWNENFLKWDAIFSEGKAKSFWDDVQSKKWWNEVWRVTKKIAIEDAIGGAVVGVGALAVNTIPGFGQVAYGSAIFLGASSQSAFAAIDIARNYDCEIVIDAPVTIADVLRNDVHLHGIC
ncbi:hypothetical protein [Marinifilum caeruleilacunae]|uniref:Uncharacterized protein n=1 Tax=Marinifilum caeruleilacunae TaxID=2499076 RepID=A0ABX1WYU9_9BACT|nr:hypothetical protein [Marinifilum caeruleilacunae]NOU61267.1 hypothetical protein [Marinifilum caeruleilacunae]